MIDAARAFGLEDLERQVAIGQVAMDPAGELVAYTRRTIAGGRDRIDLWTVPYAGGEPRQVTDGPSSDTTPRFSPDGALIAFLSGPPGGSPQLHVTGRDGGEPRRLSSFKHGAADFDWLPDGAALVVLAEDERPPGELAAGGSEQATANVIARIDWRSDAEGTALRRPRHLHRLALNGGEPERLTSGDWSASRPRVASDGALLFLADRRPGADLDPAPQVQRLAADGELETITALGGGVDRFAPEPDGALVVHAQPRPRPMDHDPLRAFRVQGDGTVTPLAPDLDRWVGEFGYDTDLHDWCTSLDDAGAVAGVADAGMVIPMRLGEHGHEPLVDPALVPVSGAIAAAGERVVAVLTLGAGAHAPEIHALEPGGPRRLTSHGSDWLDGLVLPEVEQREIDGPGGPILTTLVHPPGPRGGRATVLLPHGGPVAQWNAVPTLEAVLLAAAGYLVAMPNIRGSYDRGSDWCASLTGDWGGVDADDCHAVLDHLAAAGLADPARLGCTGLSYGGFLVNWLVGTSDRFRAAVSENGVVNQVSAWANCDHGPRLVRQAGYGAPTSREGVEGLWRASPLRHVASIHTPLLILQAADDQLCPPADNEQLFVALRWLGHEVEHVRYPEEHHTFQGDGRFDRRLDRHRRVLDWFHRHMPA